MVLVKCVDPCFALQLKFNLGDNEVFHVKGIVTHPFVFANCASPLVLKNPT